MFLKGGEGLGDPSTELFIDPSHNPFEMSFVYNSNEL